ncbi:uncharacterized protein LOC109862500 isoform X2 [Pseudomyrmex gracilis]|nr:uncharacterized protein LOC109862500 isoform X2 [Pseudomyrmex gracilis]
MTDDCPSTSMTDDWPSTSMTDDRSSISMTDDRPSTSMTDDQPSASMIDDRQSEKEKLNKEDTTKENKIVIADDDSTIADWSDPATKLLLASYFERKSKFRDPTKRKKDLWREITDVFNKQGYIISSNALGKKFRNLKTRYSTIKRNNDKKSTGKGRIMWKWYKDMEEIFHEDKSINFDKAITSMDQEDSNAVNNVTDESEILDLSTVNRRFISAALLFYFSKNCLTALYLCLSVFVVLRSANFGRTHPISEVKKLLENMDNIMDFVMNEFIADIDENINLAGEMLVQFPGQEDIAGDIQDALLALGENEDNADNLLHIHPRENGLVRNDDYVEDIIPQYNDQ